MLVFLLGNNGSGKSYLLVYFAIKFNNNIYSNFKIKIDNYIPLTINDLLNLDKLDKGNIFLDEAYTWLESRTSGNALNLLTSYLIYQKRKRHLDIYLTAQMFSSIDKRARYLANIIIECLPRVNLKKDDFNYIYKDIDTNIEISFMIPYKIAKKYFKYYNTYEIIEPQKKSRLEFNILKDNPKAMLKKIKEISKTIKSKLKIITHDSIKTALILSGYEIGYEKYLYSYMKGLINIDNN